ACSTYLEPKVAVSGACTADFECIGGFCDVTGVAAGSDGKCRALGQAGDSCANMGRCATGLDCDATTMKCTTPATPPQPPAGGMCFYSSACSYAGGARGAGTVLGVGLLLAAIAARRRRRT